MRLGDQVEHPLPDFVISRWLNCDQPPIIGRSCGRAQLIEVFQMLCPACVSHSLPQAKRAQEQFRGAAFDVIGLHSVFEHHEAQGRPEALEAFLHENRISFPVGIDGYGSGPLPRTFQNLGLSGTPTVILIDRSGQIRLQNLGLVDDMALGAAISALL